MQHMFTHIANASSLSHQTDSHYVQLSRCLEVRTHIKHSVITLSMLDGSNGDSFYVSNALDSSVGLMVEVSLRRHDGGARARVGAVAGVCPGGDSR